MLKQIIEVVKERLISIWFLVVIVMVILPSTFMYEPAIHFALTTVWFIFLFILFWASDSWLTPFRAELGVIILGAISIVKNFMLAGSGFGLMIPLVVLIAARLEEKRSFFYALFFGILTVVLSLFEKSFPMDGRIFLSIAYIGCFIGARGYRKQYEANKVSQQHLKELQKTHEELQQALDEIQEASVNTMQVAVLEERTRIARDIHDELGHSLTSLIVQLHALQYMLQNGPELAQETVKNMLDVAKQGLENIRTSVHTLARDQSSLGLTALRAFFSQTEENTGLSIDFRADEDIHLSQEMTIAFYRVLQEAVTNSLRHSDSTEMQVSIEQRHGNIHLSISDNGTAASTDTVTPGFGLSGMEERVRKVNGTLRYFFREQHGFQIDLTVPYRECGMKGMMQK